MPFHLSSLIFLFSEKRALKLLVNASAGSRLSNAE